MKKEVKGGLITAMVFVTIGILIALTNILGPIVIFVPLLGGMACMLVYSVYSFVMSFL